MEKAALISFLQHTGLVGNQAAQKIADRFIAREIGRHEFLLKEGRVCNEYLFLQAGFMRAFAHDVDGNEVTTAFCNPNGVVFEVSSFFNRTPSKENIQALADCTGWSITYDELNNLFHGMEEFRAFGRHILVKGFTVLKTRMLSMITETAEERYAGLLKTSPEIFQHAQIKHIASYLGITDTSLSRIRKEYAKK